MGEGEQFDTHRGRSRTCRVGRRYTLADAGLKYWSWKEATTLELKTLPAAVYISILSENCSRTSGQKPRWNDISLTRNSA